MTKDIAKPYDIGFGRPPKKTRFKKGQSGNPAGRPRGAKNKPKLLSNESLSKIVLDEAYREIRLNEERGQISLPIAQAVMRSITVKAAKGDHRSQKLLMEMVNRVEEQESSIRSQVLETTISYIKEADFELERRKRLGANGPDIIPHPEGFRFNEDTGLPYIAGPLTYSHKREFEATYETIQFLQGSLLELEEALEDETDEEERAETMKVIKITEDALKRLDEKIMGWRPKS